MKLSLSTNGDLIQISAHRERVEEVLPLLFLRSKERPLYEAHDGTTALALARLVDIVQMFNGVQRA